MKNKSFHPWAWVPSLYFAQGLPNVVVMSVAVVMYQRMGVPNRDIALYTSLLNIPWVIKPLWSPVVDILKTKRWWILVMELLIGAALAGVAFSLSGPFFFRMSMAVMVLLAFSSATHDIAIDGFYMLALSPFRQSSFIGVRTIFYRVAMISGQGALVMLAGRMEKLTGNVTHAWMLIFATVAGVFWVLAGYHSFILPRKESDSQTGMRELRNVMHEFFETFVSFFRKKNIVAAIIFLLLYRLAESQLMKIAPLFMLGKYEEGGLGLETEVQGFIYGTVGVVALVTGGVTGGIAIAHKGLKFWLLPMMLAMNLPDVVYVYLSYVRPEQLWLLQAAVAVEQFGFGFGFAAYLLFMIYVSDGMHKTSHYAICTAFMALGLMLPGMAAGWIQECLGYRLFFLWVMICTLPAFFILPFLNIDRGFGRK
ncbi:MAG: MFS transporter [Bacteroidales bacterium]|jgi:PAT family beta-lactamase induction signal transducer AmpG|nr:MFS transporter [Bacteroidales bacterium]